MMTVEGNYSNYFQTVKNHTHPAGKQNLTFKGTFPRPGASNPVIC